MSALLVERGELDRALAIYLPERRNPPTVVVDLVYAALPGNSIVDVTRNFFPKPAGTDSNVRRDGDVDRSADVETRVRAVVD